MAMRRIRISFTIHLSICYFTTQWCRIRYFRSFRLSAIWIQISYTMDLFGIPLGSKIWTNSLLCRYHKSNTYIDDTQQQQQQKLLTTRTTRAATHFKISVLNKCVAFTKVNIQMSLPIYPYILYIIDSLSGTHCLHANIVLLCLLDVAIKILFPKHRIIFKIKFCSVRITNVPYAGKNFISHEWSSVAR